MTSKPLTTSEPTVSELAGFLTRYGGALLGAGATCIRIEKNVRRIAEVYGLGAEISIMPSHIHLAITDPRSGETTTSIASPRRHAISFNVNTRLSELSWAMADGKTGFGEASERLDRIIDSDSQSQAAVLIAVTLANASFCRLFGGDVAAMGIVGVATLAGYYVKQLMLGAGADLRLTVLVCSFVSAVLGATDYLFSVGSTPAIALGTSVLYLVPGIPFLNSFSDMLYRHYICSFARFADAMVLTCCLSVGLCAGMLLMKTGMF